MSDFFAFIWARQAEIINQTLQHLYLTTVALLFAILVGLSIGILLARYRKLSSGTLAVLGVIQTIPSLALLGFMLPLLGIGAIPAIFALFLYALLPIVRNTYTGIEEVDDSVIEAARGMGLSKTQILRQVELPLATPIIFAGIRTAVVINVGIATLCALIAAGGLGEFIFRGIALNNSNMILAGAIPAALLALVLDSGLAIVQRYIQYLLKPVLFFSAILVLGLFFSALSPFFSNNSSLSLIAGFDPEFRERADGYPNLQKQYGLNFKEARDFDSGLMYQALKNAKVDVISGYATEGKIEAFNLRVLKDDKNSFPPYFVAPVINNQSQAKHPELSSILSLLAGKIDDDKMRKLNYRVDEEKISARQVARDFLKEEGFSIEKYSTAKGDIIVGGKKFTEQYILLEIFKILIENQSDLKVELKGGLGGTQICFDALKAGEIDLYPEYTGTALLVVLKAEDSIKEEVLQSPEKVYEYVKSQCQEKFEVTWLPPLGFNNTYALMMRNEQAQELGIESISGLKQFMDSQ